MKMENNNKIAFNRGIQDYLSLGYLYLLLLGIVSDSIFYGNMGINILSYSNILDVLLSPIIYLTRGITFPIVILLIPGIAIFLGYYFKKSHIKNRERAWYKEKYDMEKLDRVYFGPILNNRFFMVIGLIIFSAYLGYGLGAGTKTAEIIKKGDFKTKTVLTFNDGEQIKVKMIGHNSQYIFYVTENNQKVTVSPIQGNIKRIDKINSSQ